MICQFCGIEAPTKKVAFYQNIGALVIRFSKSANGHMCKQCVHKTFWTFESINLILGWWGMISLVVNIAIVPWNVIQYLMCLPMPSVPVDASIPVLDDVAIQRLQNHTDDLIAQLQSGEQFERVAENIAFKAGVSQGQVALYVRALVAAAGR